MIARATRAIVAVAVAGAALFALYEFIEQPWSQAVGPTLVHGHGHTVALTFDDGPNPYTTPAVLTTLERAHVHATFFVVGRAARAHPNLLRRMQADGDEVENHTEAHNHLNTLWSRAAINKEIDGAQSAITAAIGTPPHYLRPPFGARNRAAIEAANARGLTVVTWTAMLGDTAEADTAPESTVNKLLAKIQDGAIIVLHDGDQGRDTHAGRTYEAQATALLIKKLKAQNYTFATIAEIAKS